MINHEDIAAQKEADDQVDGQFHSEPPEAEAASVKSNIDKAEEDSFCLWNKRIGGALFAVGSLQAAIVENTGMIGANPNIAKMLSGLGQALSNGTLFQDAAQSIVANMNFVHEAPAPTSVKVGATIVGFIGTTFGAICIGGPLVEKPLEKLFEKAVDPLFAKIFPPDEKPKKQVVKQLKLHEPVGQLELHADRPEVARKQVHGKKYGNE